MICGLPSSGKSYRAHQIVSYFERRARGEIGPADDPGTSLNGAESAGSQEALIPQLSAVNLSQATSTGSPSVHTGASLSSTATWSTKKPSSRSPGLLSSSHEARLKASPDNSSIQSNLRVHLISDHSCHLPRSIYAAGNVKLEKDGRATLYSAVKRVLTKNDVVVLDSGNYIKGWRYQLHCEAKNAGTASCVVHVGLPPDKAKAVNDKRLEASEDQDHIPEVGSDLESAAYDPAVHAELLMRFEEPNPMARWDSPLFTIPWDDPEPPCEAMWTELIDGIGKDGRRKIVRPNAAAAAPPSSSSAHLYELDRTTQMVISKIQEYQRERLGESGGEMNIALGDATAKTLTLNLPMTPLTLPQMQRLRRQFISLHRQQMGGTGAGGIGSGGGGLSQQRVGELFIGFLESQWGQ